MDQADEPTNPSRLPEGVYLHSLVIYRDLRGSFTEVFRDEWRPTVKPVQWNAIFSEKNVLRGVHVHITHDDSLILLQGRVCIGLRDLRPGSPSEGMATIIEVASEAPTSLFIPHGVAHGFYCIEPSWQLLAVTEYWDPADELGCHWADPALGIPWPFQKEPVLSERDAQLPSLTAMSATIPPYQEG